MIKVPFDWEVFLREPVVVEFLSVDDVKIFNEKRRCLVDTSMDRDDADIALWMDCYKCFRFKDGVWLNMGNTSTYSTSTYSDYYYMVYDSNLDVSLSYAEVGDLL